MNRIAKRYANNLRKCEQLLNYELRVNMYIINLYG